MAALAPSFHLLNHPKGSRPFRPWFHVRGAAVPELACVASLRRAVTTLSAALEFVATQPRTNLSRWLVQLYPGVLAAGGLSQYEESSVSIPSFTTVQGVVGGWTIESL
jgi:hypothetical protein